MIGAQGVLGGVYAEEKHVKGKTDTQQTHTHDQGVSRGEKCGHASMEVVNCAAPPSAVGKGPQRSAIQTEEF